MERLKEKYVEFYECAKHINPRGMSEVIEECAPIVLDIKSKGNTHSAVCDYLGTTEEDMFIIKLKNFWEE